MISVCIATYNGEKYIKQQIDSILSQLGDEDELIISDDGSTDKTLEIISNYKDNRIKVFHHRKNEQLLTMKAVSFRLSADNFENAIKNAQGDYIYLSDQDDIWLPGRIRKTQPYLSQYDLVMCNYKVIDDLGNIVMDKFYKENPVGRFLITNMSKTPFLGCCMSFRRSVLNYCLPFPKECIGHDFWMGCLILHLGSFGYIKEPLHLYRKHYDNVSPATGKSRNPFWFRVSYRIQFICQIILRSIKYKSRRK